jgi:hypothetical protein
MATVAGSVLLCGLICGLSYWATSFILHPNDSIDTLILYRFGDTDYLPLIFNLAKLNFREFVVYEHARTELLPFPWLGMSLHAVMIFIFGKAGFLAADLVVSFIWLAAIHAILRAIFPDGRLAAAFTILFFDIFQNQSTCQLPIYWPYPGIICSPFGYRYTRPFVAGIFMVALLLTTHRLNESLREAESDWRPPTVHGVLLGLVAQVDVHMAMIGSIVTAAIAAFRLAIGPSDRSIVLKLAALAGCCFFLAAAPLFIQVPRDEPDILGRWGLFPIDRFNPPILVSHVYLAATFGLCAFLTLWTFRARRRDDERFRTARRMFGVVVLFAIAAICAIPISGVVLGKGIQIYHFYDRGLRFLYAGYCAAIVVLICFAVGTGISFMPAIRPYVRSHAVSAMFATGLVLTATGSVGEAVTAASTAHQPRVWGDGWPANETYRQDLNLSIAEVSNEKYRSATVLGTVDQQLAMWWLAFRGGFLFIPDTFTSTASDDFIARRTTAFMRLVGDGPDTFQRRIHQPYFQIRFFSLAKWQASAAWVPAPLTDYTSDQIAAIDRTSVIDAWHIAVPRSEVTRLMRYFSESRKPGGRLDLIILPRIREYDELPGPGRPYGLAYQNTSFRVWLRETATPPANNSD